MNAERARTPSGQDGLPLRLAAGDPAAPGEMVERHRAELCRYARALLGDASSAEDAVQEAFVRAFVALGKYEEGRIGALSLRPWLYRIVLNVVRNAWRDGRREVYVAEADESAEPVFDTAREPWMDAVRALARLPERQRVAVTLRYMEDLPYSEVSCATGWPENTCKTLVRRGLRRMEKMMSSHTTEVNRDGG